MSSIPLEILFIFILITINGFLAMTEIAIVSARKARLQRQAEDGDEKARAALELAKDPSDFLSTVQIGITLVGVLAGAFGGATIATKLAEWIKVIPTLAPFSDAISITVVVLIITYLNLVLGELVPKRYALTKPEDIAARSASPMRRLSSLSSPLVRFLSGSTNLVLRILGVRKTDEIPITEEEIKILLDQGTQAGVFAEAEQEMVEAVFRFGDRNVGALMTPRTEITWLDLEDSKEDNQKKIIEGVFARFPVARGDLDDTIGLVQAKDLLAGCLADEDFDLESVLIEPLIVPESIPALRVLEKFKESGIHTAFVIDEFGGFQGLVTAFDILEAIVGDIPMLGESMEPEIIQREDGSWLLDGLFPVDEFKEMFGIRHLPGEERGYFQSIGGFVMTHLGRIPNAGDYFDWEGLRFEVADMDGLRVDKLIVVPLDESTTNGEQGA
jgi:putative hemolysin